MRWLNRNKYEVLESETVMHTNVTEMQVCINQMHEMIGWYLNCPEKIFPSLPPFPLKTTSG